MTGGLTAVTQDHFDLGAFQSVDTQRIPDGGVYDIQNGLLDSDEGVIYRRGGAAYKSSADAANSAYFQSIWDGYLYPGRRTVMPASGSDGVLYALDTNDTSLFDVVAAGGNITWARGRLVEVAGLLAARTVTPADTVTLWGGSLNSTFSYSTGTISVTAASRSVTGSGTTWTSNLTSGMIITTAGKSAVIASVDSNTALTLATEWWGSTAAGAPYSAQRYNHMDLLTLYPQMADGVAVACLGTAGNRLLLGQKNRMYMSDIRNPFKYTTDSYHEFPTGANMLGIEQVGNNALVFTTAGTFLVANLALDLTDADGNIQQTVSRYAPEIVLWDEMGIATWQNAVVVPAVDNVYLLDGGSSPVAVGSPIRDTWRDYVAAGYVLGRGTVYQDQYVVPVLSTAGTAVASWVCHLPSRSWSRQDGYSGLSLGFARRIGATTQQTALLSIRAGRVLDCTSWFAPSGTYKNEADGTTHTFSVTTRDFTIGSLKSFVKKLRLWSEGVDAASDSPTIGASYATGPAGSSFTSLTGTAGASTGDAPSKVWAVNAAGKRVRFKLSSTSPWASLKIKALDLFVRPRGRV